MKKYGWSVVLSILLMAFSSQAQDTLWTGTYGGTGDDWCHSLIEASSGGFLIAGETESFGMGVADIYLVRTDERGDTLWTKTYGGTNWDWGYSVIEVASGGFLIAGATSSFGKGLSDVYLVRTNDSGDTLWTKTYGGADWDYGYSVIEISTGGFLIAGETKSFGSGLSDLYLIKTNASGDILWTKTYGGAASDVGFSVINLSTGGFLIAGATRSFGMGSSDVYLVRTDASGDTLWTRTYGGTGADEGYSVIEVSSGGFLIAGEKWSLGTSSDVYLIRTDAGGDTLWTKTYGGIYEDYSYSVIEASSAGFLIAGETESFGKGYYDVFLIRTDAGGNTVWTRTYGGTDDESGKAVIEVSSGEFMIAGETESFGMGLSDVYLLYLAPWVGIEETQEMGIPKIFS
ncbi:MAG: hypothetical protein D6732_26430, partial [Methanobacteriota archaeon]